MKLWFYLFLIPWVCLGQDNVGILDGPISKPLLEDTFATPLSAGSVNGTYSTGRAPGLRTVTDAGNKISITGNTALFTGGGTSEVIAYPSIIRSSGVVMEGSVIRSGSSVDALLGFGNVNNSWPFKCSLDCDQTTISIHDGLSSALNVGANLTLNTQFKLGVILRASGGFYFVSGGAYSQWSLLYSANSDSTSTLYPAINNSSAIQNLSVSNLVIPKTKWIPSPIASDSFVRANGALGVTDGNGTQERNGGAGLTWNAPGWVVSGNTASNGMATPSNPVTSGLVGYWKLDDNTGTAAIDSSGSANTLTLNSSAWATGIKSNCVSYNGSSSYSVCASVPSVTNWSVSYWFILTNSPSGAFENNMFGDLDAAGSTPWLTSGFTSGKNLRLAGDSGSGSVSIDTSGITFIGGLWYHVVETSESKIYVNGIVRATGASLAFAWSGLSGGRFIFGREGDFATPRYLNGSLDDVRVYNREITSGEVQQIYLAGNTALLTNSTANVVAETSFTGSTSQSGLVLNYDGATGTNLLTSYFDGAGNVKVDQTVNGNTTNLISGAVTYVANARLLTVSAPSEGQVRVYYNNAFVNSSTGIWPGFTNFTQHGLYSQGSGSFTNYASFARGTEGQYSPIDTLK